MPNRTIEIEGQRWSVFPSGYVTQSDGDEFGVLFVRGTGAERVVRVSRYSPTGTRSRERALAEMSDAALHELFACSQSSAMSPEAGYAS
ncbi:MAG: hypothetical protein HYR75_06075 [Gemmatimonadetes bacterium]|nr:hypothetical protein [Gemmatimonadota bacterium]MBI3566944.1 hypothetical protein [Gemmatimonadota bacterium]